MKTVKSVAFIFTLLVLNTPVRALAQTRKVRFPAGLYTSDNSDIYGISFGVGSNTYTGETQVRVRSNGIRIEPISQALLIATLIFPYDSVPFPVREEDYESFGQKVPNEIINGLNLSCGTNAFANVNGITISALTQSLKNVRGVSVVGLGGGMYSCYGLNVAGAGTEVFYLKGLSVATLTNSVYIGHGVQISGFNDFKQFTGFQLGLYNDLENKSESFTGVQIGLINKTKKLRGIQIGLFNKNEKRTLPFFNWNFK